MGALVEARSTTRRTSRWSTTSTGHARAQHVQPDVDYIVKESVIIIDEFTGRIWKAALLEGCTGLEAKENVKVQKRTDLAHTFQNYFAVPQAAGMTARHQERTNSRPSITCAWSRYHQIRNDPQRPAR